MIGDIIDLNESYLKPAQQIMAQKPIVKGAVISISGESGSGKSTLALALKKVLEEVGLKGEVLHMDDYFILPPATNHAKREADITWVGPGEVRLDLLQQHLDAFKSGIRKIQKPLVDYGNNSIGSEELSFENVDVVIAEGTYTSSLNTELSIFIDRTYKDTFEDRVKRARDPITPFVEQVLAIEHHIISQMGKGADVIVDKNFEIKFC